MVNPLRADEHCSTSPKSVCRDTSSTPVFGRTVASCPAHNIRIMRRDMNQSFRGVHLRDFDVVDSMGSNSEYRSYVAVASRNSNKVVFFPCEGRSDIFLCWSLVEKLISWNLSLRRPQCCCCNYYYCGLLAYEVGAWWVNVIRCYSRRSRYRSLCLYRCTSGLDLIAGTSLDDALFLVPKLVIFSGVNLSTNYFEEMIYFALWWRSYCTLLYPRDILYCSSGTEAIQSTVTLYCLSDAFVLISHLFFIKPRYVQFHLFSSIVCHPPSEWNMGYYQNLSTGAKGYPSCLVTKWGFRQANCSAVNFLDGAQGWA